MCPFPLCSQQTTKITGAKSNGNSHTTRQLWSPSVLVLSPTTYEGAMQRFAADDSPFSLKRKGVGLRDLVRDLALQLLVPPGTRSGRSHRSADPAAARRPVGNTSVPASGTGCGSGAATATGGISRTRRSACPGTGGRGSATGCASRSASSAYTSSGGASWTRTWTCFSSGSEPATTPGSSRWSRTERSRKTSGSWTPRTGGWTGPTETSRGTLCPAANRATGRSRTETSRPEAASFPPSLRIPARKLGA